jgi:hypothetical protein
MRGNAIRRCKLALLVGTAMALLAGVNACRSSQRRAAPVAEQSATTRATATPQQLSGNEAKVVSERRKGYFDHLRKEHRVKPHGPLESCSVCHRRDAAQTSDVKLGQPERRTATWLPFHDACTQCHAVEAFQQTAPETLEKSPLCAACHQGGITQNNQALLINYPGRLNEFGLLGIAGGQRGFSHKVHTDPQKMGEAAELAKCSTCHRFDQSGVQATFPRHAECFTCHVHQAQQKLGDCGVCHINTALAVTFIRGPEQAFKLFRFRHSAAHLKAASCDKCHRPLEPASTSRVDILKISTGQGQRHTSACWSCHKQAQEPVCTKCHTTPPLAVAIAGSQ